MTRKVTIHCTDANGAWTEEYIEGEAGSFRVGDENPEAWARTLVSRFNETLRANEQPRTVVRVDVAETDQVAKLQHRWEKTNLVTIMRGSRSYDTARCVVCHATAKRYGVGPYTLDARYARYEFCPGIPV